MTPAPTTVTRMPASYRLRMGARRCSAVRGGGAGHVVSQGSPAGTMEPGRGPELRGHSRLARAMPARDMHHRSPHYPMTDLTTRPLARRPRPRSRLPFATAIAAAFLLAVSSPGVVLGWDN